MIYKKTKPKKIVYATAWFQLKQQLKKCGIKEECFFLNFPLEEGNLPFNLSFPNADELVFLLPNDVRSHIVLYYLAKDFKGEIFIVHVTGEYTSLSPFAVSDSEMKVCLGNKEALADSMRKELSFQLKEILNTPDRDCYWQLCGNRLHPLPHQEVYEFILSKLEGEMKMARIVGVCMGLAPMGWPGSDVFYLNRIEELVDKEKLIVTKVSKDPFQRFISLP